MGQSEMGQVMFGFMGNNYIFLSNNILIEKGIYQVKGNSIRIVTENGIASGSPFELRDDSLRFRDMTMKRFQVSTKGSQQTVPLPVQPQTGPWSALPQTMPKVPLQGTWLGTDYRGYVEVTFTRNTFAVRLNGQVIQ